MIVRTGRRIPGVVPLGGVHAPISVVRMAVGDAYGAKEWREGEGDDEVAFRTERIERRICRAVAEFAFRLAERTGAKVFGGPKYTVSPIYEGMLKEEMDAAAARHPDVPYEPQLIDATFALLIASSGDPLVIPALNRDGDILSDLVLPLFGSIAGSESLLVALRRRLRARRVVLAEAAHGTAPSLQGKNVANPMAMILAAAALLALRGRARRRRPSRAIREACLEAVADGVRTADLGGHAGTTEFTDEVIRRTKHEARGLVDALADLAAARDAASSASANNSTKTRAIVGSNCVPAQRSTSASASSRAERAGRAGRSSSRRTRRRRRACAPRAGSPRPPCPTGSRCRPSARGGRARTGSPRAARAIRSRILAPIFGCSRISASSSASSSPSLCSTSSRDGELADVVQRAAEPQRRDPLLAPAEGGTRAPRPAR